MALNMIYNYAIFAVFEIGNDHTLQDLVHFPCHFEHFLIFFYFFFCYMEGSGSATMK